MDDLLSKQLKSYIQKARNEHKLQNLTAGSINVRMNIGWPKLGGDHEEIMTKVQLYHTCCTVQNSKCQREAG